MKKFPLQLLIQQRSVQGKNKIQRYSIRKKVRTSRRKRKLKKKNITNFLEIQTNKKFNNIDINDVWALRASTSLARDQITEVSSEGDDQNDKSIDSLRGMKKPSFIQIGNLEDKAIAEARKIYAHEIMNPK